MDIVAFASTQAASGSGYAPAAAFVAGAAASFGPCAAPRFIALSALVGSERGTARAARIGAFVAGIALGSTAIGCVASLIHRVAAWSSFVYLAMACAFGIMGLRMLVRVTPHTCARAARPRRRSFGVAFLLGASFAFVASPCCTPAIAALAMLSGAAGTPLVSASVVGAFALGHAAPFTAMAHGSVRIGDTLAHERFREPFVTVSAALMIALAAYYTVLA